MQEVLDFSDYEEKVIPVKLKLNGSVGSYKLREASGAAVRKYKNARLEACVYEDGRLASVKPSSELDLLLVSLCLFDKDDELVPKEDIDNLPHPITAKLFEQAEEISGLKEEPQEPIKKLLVGALNRPDSPLPLNEFRSYLSGLPKAYEDLVEMVALTPEEEAKNLSDGTTDGSE